MLVLSESGQYLYHSLPVAQKEPDGSITVFFKINSKQYNDVGLPDLIESLSNPIINYRQANKKEITSVSITEEVKRACQIKYGSLGKALEFAANV